MRRNVLLGILVLFLIVTPVLADYPTLKPYVNDFANILTTDEEVLLNHLCTEIEANTTVEIAVVTIKTTNGQERVRYANELGEKSGVGKKATDNGVVVLWSLSNEKGGAIATGRGIESILNDAKTGRIGRASRKYFDEEQYKEGFEYIILEIGKEVGYGKQTVLQTESEEITITDMIAFFIILFIIFCILMVLVAVVDTSGGGSGWIGTSVGGGFSGGGFGGGSFGGGGSSF